MRLLAVAATAAVLTAGCAGADGPHPQWQAAVATPAPSATTPAAKVRIVESDGLLKGPIGDLIHTGLREAGGKEYVIYGVTGGGVSSPKDFGFAIGYLEGKGVTADDSVTEWEGSPSAPGFHPMNGQKALVDGSVQPAYGYYAGTPAKITVKEAGRVIEAHLARWSHDPGITVFWFDPADVQDDERWAELGAYDAAGAKLPDGRILRM